LGKVANKKGDKETQKEGNESESEESKEQTQEQSKETAEEQKEHKHEFDVYCATCAKKDLPTRIVYGDLAKQFNEYQRSYLKNFADSGKSLSKDNTNIFNRLKDVSFAETYFTQHKEQFDLSVFDNVKKNVNSFDSQSQTHRNYYDLNKKGEKIDNLYDDFLKSKGSQNTTSETGFEQ